MHHHENQQKNNNNNQQSKASQKATPKIVERVNKIPAVNFAISVGFSQYDRLKASNITVGEVMTRAESWAVFVWQKMQPIIEKLQDPIKRADQLACTTFDYVEDKLKPVDQIVKRCRGQTGAAAAAKS